MTQTPINPVDAGSSMQTGGRYVVTLLFPVPDIAVDHFLAIHQHTTRLYKQLGVENVEIYRLADGTAKYGCVELGRAVLLRNGEQLIMVTDSYPNKDAFLRISELANQNSAITTLFEELMAIIDISRVSRAEFELVQS